MIDRFTDRDNSPTHVPLAEHGAAVPDMGDVEGAAPDEGEDGAGPSVPIAAGGLL